MLEVLSAGRAIGLSFSVAVGSVAVGGASAGCSAPLASAAGAEVDEGTSALRVSAEPRTPVDQRACPGEDAAATEARQAVAYLRSIAGLPPLRCDARASRAAAGHCVYLVTNGEFSHLQRRGRPKFTGVTFVDRLEAAGFEDDPGGEVLASFGGAQAIDHPRGWMNSVYHRAPFLRIENVSFGYGGQTGCAAIEFGRKDRAKPPPAQIVWPPDGARGVPTTFRADREIPNPVPGATAVGGPVSLIGTEPIVQIEAELVGPKGRLPAALITADNDLSGLVRKGEVHLVPRAPLLPGTDYVATFRGRTKGAFVVTTRFRTREGTDPPLSTKSAPDFGGGDDAWQRGGGEP